MDIKELLKQYAPCNAQETQDKLQMIEALESLKNPLSRENGFAHFTASSWIVNQDRSRVLMAYHNIYNTWSWTGGHADGESDLLSVAIREAREETGIENISPISTNIYSIEIIPVNAHMKHGRFVSPHLHLNVTFLLTADDHQKIHCKPDENSAVAWLPLNEAADNRDEPHMKVIYQKLNEKLHQYM